MQKTKYVGDFADHWFPDSLQLINLETNLTYYLSQYTIIVIKQAATSHTFRT